MTRFLAATIALAASALGALLPGASFADDRNLPIRFELHQEGPAASCEPRCRILVSAAGAITAQTAKDFRSFSDGRNLRGATIVLDSDGGSVHGAIELGRELRRLDMITTVGRVIDLASDGSGAVRASVSPRADCESMCTFVLLGGTQRLVPPQARVMVHQIWLGDRREDPTAASYSAEDLVLVQRDIGRLAKYIADMGGSSDILELALRIPPWEPMYSLTREELRRMRLDTSDRPPEVAAPATAAAAVTTVAASEVRGGAITERGWAVIDRSGASVLARRHPLTVEGDEIGSFDLTVACSGDDGFQVSYVERRQGFDGRQPVPPLTVVTLRVGGIVAPLKVVSSEQRDQPGALNTLATGTVPAELIKTFGATGSHSIMIKTANATTNTAIRIGNTGVWQSLPQLTASCRDAIAKRADLPATKTGGLARRQ